MKRGFRGGVEAAQSLHGYVVERLSGKAVNTGSDLGVVIYVYAHVQELVARYPQPDLLKASEVPKAQGWVQEFRQGFNSAHPWSCLTT